MSRFVFKVPDVGEGTTEAEIVKWNVSVGDHVREDQALLDLMTDKATVEVASPVAGRIVSRHGEEGDKVAVGAELLIFEVEGGEAKAASETTAPPAQTAAAGEPQARPASEGAAAGGKVLAAPAVRARARALGIDLATIQGRGPDGRVLHADLDARLRAGGAPAAEHGVEEIRIVGLRRRIAERLQEAKRRIPHFAYVEEVDVTALEALRAKLNASGGTRPHLTPLAFIARALIAAIAEEPQVNAHFDDAQGVLRRYRAVHLGIAAQTPDGLMVPVIRDAQELDIWGLAREIARLGATARAGKARADQLTGSTITLTSLGALGGVASTPIVNPPEVAIVGVNRIALRPIAHEGAVALRAMMNLSSSFDHRIVDGFAAARFIAAIKARLESPGQLAPDA